MTATEMRDLFLILYDKVTNYAAPGYLDSEIASFLDKAVEQFIKRHYNFKGNSYQEGFEETEKRRKDLSELVRNVNLTSSDQSSDQTGVSANGVFYDMPLNMLWALREEITISSSDSCLDGNRLLVKPVTHDEYAININNPFKKPDKTMVWRLDFSRVNTGDNQIKRHELVVDGTTITPSTITTYHLRYLKRPEGIVINTDPSVEVNCELDQSTHREIVDIAVRIAAGITDPQTYQIKLAEEAKTE